MDLELQLNPEQAAAVRQTEGPVLILAGAGSGKTRTIVHRMAYLLQEAGVPPWQLLALTFTNKAAKEMKSRIEELAPLEAAGIWVTTFHSTCLRILLRQASLLGYPPGFEIADTSDQITILREVYKRLGIKTKDYPEKMVANIISSAKDKLIGPGAFASENAGDSSMEKVVEIYREYQGELFRNGLMDFDDLLMNAVILFREFPDILESYQDRFRYIMVDEYQDTNFSQFEFIRLLSAKYRNLCVVGDDDQSIYSFRGADIRNILDFEEIFPDAKVFRLEENYRSTGNILAAANEVIKHNRNRKAKELWTEGAEGSLIRYKQLPTPENEASFVADDIKKKMESGRCRYGDFAVLMRTNIQSKELEDAFRMRRIDYDVVKGLRFWDTKVIKDLTSYLLTIAGGANDMRTNRIINLPRRGIGASTVEKAKSFALEQGIMLLDACAAAEEIPGISEKSRKKLIDFYKLIEDIKDASAGKHFSEILDIIIDKVGYKDYMMGEAENPDKLEEMHNYVSKLKETLEIYEEETEEPDLLDFMRQNGLEGNALDKEGRGEKGNQVLIMTAHNAKGLEFPHVYLVGMEETLFPTYASIISEDPWAIEEERRLCYVAITRAKQSLTVTSSRSRRKNGEYRYMSASRFLREIPLTLLDMNINPNKTERELRIPEYEKNTAHEAFMLKYPVYSTSAGKASSKQKSGLSNVKTDEFGRKVFQKIQLGSEIVGEKPDYAVGDRVLHFKFGEGTVKDIEKQERDYLITVDFDRSGVKKMFAGFAKLKPV